MSDEGLLSEGLLIWEEVAKAALNVEKPKFPKRASPERINKIVVLHFKKMFQAVAKAQYDKLYPVAVEQGKRAGKQELLQSLEQHRVYGVGQNIVVFTETDWQAKQEEVLG